MNTETMAPIATHAGYGEQPTPDQHRERDRAAWLLVLRVFHAHDWRDMTRAELCAAAGIGPALLGRVISQHPRSLQPWEEPRGRGVLRIHWVSVDCGLARSYTGWED